MQSFKLATYERNADRYASRLQQAADRLAPELRSTIAWKSRRRRMRRELHPKAISRKPSTHNAFTAKA